MASLPQLLVIDFGSQYTLVIGRTLRELGYRSLILSSIKAETYLTTHEVKGVILSGGDQSVYDKDAPTIPMKLLKGDVPLLGICYGMQGMAHQLGGQVKPEATKKEYGPAEVSFKKNSLFKGLKEKSIVWASHGDSVKKVPKDFSIVALSKDGTIAAMAHNKKKLWGVQFHPEVTHTKEGKKLLQNFLNECEVKKDWDPKDVVNEIREEVKESAQNKRAVIGFSGGVDSTTLSAVLAPVFKNKLLGICIDTGGLRHDELTEIKKHAKAAKITLKIIDAKNEFRKAIGDMADAEMVRKKFREVYKKIFETEARKFKADFIVQGTLATDLIESGKEGNSALIKTHHNVGLNFSCGELHPFRTLFKYEVRDIARKLGLPASVTERHPFPGPGLYVRMVGGGPTSERLELLRWADAQITDIVRKTGLYEQISQLVVGLLCVPTVGVKGDARVYAYSVIIRAVVTSDFMTAHGFWFPEEVVQEIKRIITKHPEIVRVFFDPTDKPPATTEFM